ncbi:MAG: hypothetical protein EPO11_06600 [Gammaproteobacteria bacterium]|nr:MAG: hypothetical protein EPO11_06600 [Gammaproteobacteria bacterium]
MNEWLISLRNWYEPRPSRERVLILFLGWAIVYALFYFIFFSPLDKESKALHETLKTEEDTITNWEVQIAALNKIATTPLYKKWQQQNKLFVSLHQKYKNLLKSSSTKQWQDIIKTVLQAQTNITLVQIKDFPEVVYNPANLPISSTTLYEQRLLVVIFSNYFDTIDYIQHLESLLPNIHWNSLNYQVTQYPVAKIEMEFSIFYDKSNA